MSVVFTKRLKVEMKTCREVVATGRYPYTGWFGRLSKEDEQIVDKVMELVHITAISEQDFNKISDGQKQRVMLARAICHELDHLEGHMYVEKVQGGLYDVEFEEEA